MGLGFGNRRPYPGHMFVSPCMQFWLGVHRAGDVSTEEASASTLRPPSKPCTWSTHTHACRHITAVYSPKRLWCLSSRLCLSLAANLRPFKPLRPPVRAERQATLVVVYRTHYRSRKHARASSGIATQASPHRSLCNYCMHQGSTVCIPVVSAPCCGACCCCAVDCCACCSFAPCVNTLMRFIKPTTRRVLDG